MSTTITAGRRLTALIVATAALGAGAAVVASEASSSPAITHSVAMYKENPDACRVAPGDPGFHVSDAYASGGAVCP